MSNRNKSKKRSLDQMPEISIRVHPFANPEERTQVLKNLAISSEFEMRHRGLFEYYGKEFIAYKLEKPKDKNRNEFLRAISHYMTTHLEDNCPPSWKDCGPSFWEEFIFAHYPHLFMKITPEEIEVETFLYELKRFIRWLDKQAGTSWYGVVESYVLNSAVELKTCERLLNALFLNDYPQIYQDDWNPIEDIEKIEQEYHSCSEKRDSLFEVTNVFEDIVELTEFETGRIFQVIGLPCQFFTLGTIMNGAIAIKSEDVYWKWYNTLGVYPNRAKKFFRLKQH